MARNISRHAVTFQPAYDALDITKHARTLTWHTQDSGDFTVRCASHYYKNRRDRSLAVFPVEVFYGKLISLFFFLSIARIRTLSSFPERTVWFNREFARILERYTYPCSIRRCVSVNERERLCSTCTSMWLTRWKSHRSLLSASNVSRSLSLLPFSHSLALPLATFFTRQVPRG